MRRELAALRQRLEQELRAALAASDDTQQPSSSSSSSSAGWLGRWFGGGSSGAAAVSRRPTVASIRAGEHPALQHAADELQRLVRQYNNACLADKEAFGSFWPLDRMKQLDWEAEVEAALARIGGGGGGGGGGGSSESSGSNNSGEHKP